MRQRNLMAFFVATFVVFPAIGATHGWAAGYWNLPGTYWQRTGHGYGGGYHAPFTLGPIKCNGWHARNDVRLAHSPAPIYGCAYGCDCGRSIEAPSVIEGVVPMTTAPIVMQPAPSSAAAPLESNSLVVATPVVSPRQSLFEPPVQP